MRADRRTPRRGGHRTATPSPQKKQHSETFLAPIAGLVLTQPLAVANKRAARVLENWFPTQTGARVRGGAQKLATLSATTEPVESLFSYTSGATQKFFGACDGGIYDITTVVDPDSVPTADLTGQTSDYYSTIQLANIGGSDYLYAVNGTDIPQLYDGASWEGVSDATHELPYDAEVGTFTVGLTVTGAGGATGVITELIDNGTTGILRLSGITGTWNNDEQVTDTSTGDATTNIPSGIVVLTATVTGVETNTFSFVWKFANRLFFVEKDTQSVWYLAVDSIGGAATEFSLASVFATNSPVLFGGRWSSDSGSGLDDRCVFVSEEGDVAVYEGTDPSTAADWVKVGAYQISPPLGRNGFTHIGGDLLIATKDGLVPMSQIISKDPVALNLASVTYNIDPLWQLESETRTLPWEVLKINDQNMMVISLPITATGDNPRCFVANMETGGWALYTGWDTRCLGLYDNNGYFGTSDGLVHRMEQGGSDNGIAYTCAIGWYFDDFGAPGRFKEPKQARAIYKASVSIIDKITSARDYNETMPSPPSSLITFTTEGWDSGLWDDAVWDDGLTPTQADVASRWRSIYGPGYSLAPQLQITFGVTSKPFIDLVQIDMTYEVGGLVV